MADNLTVPQLKVRGIRSQLTLLENLLIDKGIHLACFTETKTKQPPRLKDFILAACIDDNRHSSTIYVRCGLKFKLINTNVVKSDSKNNEIRLTDSQTDIIFVCCSRDLATEPTHANYSNGKNLILGDLNMRCPNINPKTDYFKAT